MYYVQLDPMALVSKGTTLSAFIIYKWIEREDKDAILQQTWELLQKKIIQPNSGAVCSCSAGVCAISLAGVSCCVALGVCRN